VSRPKLMKILERHDDLMGTDVIVGIFDDGVVRELSMWHNNNGPNCTQRVWTWNIPRGIKDYPWAKPVEIYERP